MEDFFEKHVKGLALARLWVNALSVFAPKDHAHSKASITDFPTALKNPMTLIVKVNGTEVAAYNGAESKQLNLVAGDDVEFLFDAATNEIKINAKVNNEVHVGSSAPTDTKTKVWFKFTE